MSAPRSGPFAWSPFGDGYLVASTDPTGHPVVDLVLPSPDGVLRWVAAFAPDDVESLVSLSVPPVAAAPVAAAAPAVRPDAGRARARSADRRLTTMGGLALALGMVAVFWIALGVLLWTLLR
ncbi:hypothetical protein [Jiangella sp. DSM 45060]|uniref:hypothetical protein n=1 Tax=Jiangella sp. DSM 45060 TaxID=1798224 RepID=UPI00087DC929|nr:hypothetical protein [Jiangella sp. DSM 45060]SDS29187.1 hypothetical protein SAMN04515669_0763 [Jiangella sp. DSM 45060]